jgi:hypothetical protein
MRRVGVDTLRGASADHHDGHDTAQQTLEITYRQRSKFHGGKPSSRSRRLEPKNGTAASSQPCAEPRGMRTS